MQMPCPYQLQYLEASMHGITHPLCPFLIMQAQS